MENGNIFNEENYYPNINYEPNELKNRINLN